MNPIILIPARMASTRLPGKPLADIAGLPMIAQCYARAREANLARIVVACDDAKIAQAIADQGGEAVLTDPDLPSGSDRIYAALQQVDAAGKHDIVINLQGDMPTLDPAVIASVLKPFSSDTRCDIATLAAEIGSDEERDNPAVVKVVISRQASGVSGEASQQANEALRSKAWRDSAQPTPALSMSEANSLLREEEPSAGAINKALYFSRSVIPHGSGPHYHHIGIYAYRRAALERFVALPPSSLEQQEKLEQLRALEDGMVIRVEIVDTVPLGVDTPEQLEQARQVLAG